MNHQGLSWFGIFRLGLVQTALGAVVVLTTSTFNRVMVVELSLAAVLPGLLVAAHYAIQIMRPRFGHGSDQGGRRTPWIIGGVGVLGLGGTLAAAAIALAVTSTAAGLALSLIAYLMIGAGVGAAGTSLLVLLAEKVSPARRAAAATITWIMMIVGFIVTTGIVGSLLDPFSMSKLVSLTASVGLIALVVTTLAIGNIENASAVQTPGRAAQAPEAGSFKRALREVLSERKTRRFGLFVFLSMLAYSAQDLLLEPFAGALFGYTPGDSTQLGGIQHSGVLLGMLLVALIGSGLAKGRQGPLRACMIGGCIGSACMLLALAAAAYAPSTWPLTANVFGLGLANGMFAVAAIGSMMTLVSSGHENRDGVRMGVWGAAQAVAFGLGGILGTGTVDLAMWWFSNTTLAYALAFILQASLFLGATLMAISLGREAADKLREEPQTLNSMAS
ncbi:MAG: BCD family MFS transporter [Gammaproteobacteria bacterium]